MNSKITVTPTHRSAITALKAKFAEAGIEPENREFMPLPNQLRDNYRPGSRVSDLGAGLRPIKQPNRRRRGRPSQRDNPGYIAKEFEAKYPFNCKYCGKAGMGKTERREFCNRQCGNRWEVAKKKEKNNEKV